jgi:GNAT superfamily N-acetyltransferase
MDAFCVEVAGTTVGGIQLWRRGDGAGVLEFLFVMPSHQKKGYGRQLVREAVAAARSAGIELVEVYAMDREPEARAFWEHLLGTPNTTGVAMILGQQWSAKGWRLATADIVL